jgi:hypothetical protein
LAKWEVGQTGSWPDGAKIGGRIDEVKRLRPRFREEELNEAKKAQA